ncbi:hypothetical protein KFU94_17675 [Chloroflexi bacterium TSY]|nr:hypothetical protein [Chloroflexi bacterium TSY]
MLGKLKELAFHARTCLKDGEFDELGYLLDQSWAYKRQLASRVSNSIIDDLYSSAKKAGALGGKIAGAGGGGFLLLYCQPAKQDAVRAVLSSLPELSFRLECDGSKVIFNYRR